MEIKKSNLLVCQGSVASSTTNELLFSSKRVLRIAMSSDCRRARYEQLDVSCRIVSSSQANVVIVCVKFDDYLVWMWFFSLLLSFFLSFFFFFTLLFAETEVIIVCDSVRLRATECTEYNKCLVS